LPCERSSVVEHAIWVAFVGPPVGCTVAVGWGCLHASMGGRARGNVSEALEASSRSWGEVAKGSRAALVRHQRSASPRCRRANVRRHLGTPAGGRAAM